MVASLKAAGLVANVATSTIPSELYVIERNAELRNPALANKIIILYVSWIGSVIHSFYLLLEIETQNKTNLSQKYLRAYELFPTKKKKI